MRRKFRYHEVNPNNIDKNDPRFMYKTPDQYVLVPTKKKTRQCLGKNKDGDYCREMITGTAETRLCSSCRNRFEQCEDYSDAYGSSAWIGSMGADDGY